MWKTSDANPTCSLISVRNTKQLPSCTKFDAQVGKLPPFAYSTACFTGKMIVHFTQGVLGGGEVITVSKLKRIPHVPKSLINLIHLGAYLKSFLPGLNETRSNNNLLYNTRSRREFTLHLHY